MENLQKFGKPLNCLNISAEITAAFIITNQKVNFI